MADELQHLIDRIQTEAVEKADSEGAAILAKAKEKAAAIVAEGEEKAAAALKKAEKDAEAYSERSIKTIEQAARDLLITVGNGIENIVSDLVTTSVSKAMDESTLKEMLVHLVDRYAAADGEAGLDVLLSEEDQTKLVDFFKERYREAMAGGVQLHADHNILKGFQVSFKNEKVYHDFTQEAIAEALGGFLRPKLAEIVHRVASANGSKGDA